MLAVGLLLFIVGSNVLLLGVLSSFVTFLLSVGNLILKTDRVLTLLRLFPRLSLRPWGWGWPTMFWSAGGSSLSLESTWEPYQGSYAVLTEDIFFCLSSVETLTEDSFAFTFANCLICCFCVLVVLLSASRWQYIRIRWRPKWGSGFS